MFRRCLTWARRVNALLPLRVIFGLCFIRLVAVPCVCFAAAYAALRSGSGWLSRDPLVVLLILVESAVPSAQMVMVFLSKYSAHDSATKMSLAYLVQYPLAMLTFAAFTTVALYWTQQYIK